MAAVVVLAAIAACVGTALLGRAVSTAAQRVRGWYRGSVEGSTAELVVLAAVIGALLGELYMRMRP